MSKRQSEEIQDDILLQDRSHELVIHNAVTQDSTNNVNTGEVEGDKELVSKRQSEEMLKGF